MKEDISEDIKNELLKAAAEGPVECGKALIIARRLNVSPMVVGKACDLLHIRVRSCSPELF